MARASCRIMAGFSRAPTGPVRRATLDVFNVLADEVDLELAAQSLDASKLGLREASEDGTADFWGCDLGSNDSP